MSFTSSIAKGPATPVAVILQVRRQLDHDLAVSTGKQWQDVDRAVESAVRESWLGRVKTFVPVLALREARDYLREHVDQVERLPREPDHIARISSARSLSRDAMDLDYDILLIDTDDVLRF